MAGGEIQGAVSSECPSHGDVSFLRENWLSRKARRSLPATGYGTARRTAFARKKIGQGASPVAGSPRAAAKKNEQTVGSPQFGKEYRLANLDG
jgi:hypothetical protein